MYNVRFIIHFPFSLVLPLEGESERVSFYLSIFFPFTMLIPFCILEMR